MAYKTNHFEFKILTPEEQQNFNGRKDAQEGIVYIDQDTIWLKCPCGCGEVYQLNSYRTNPKTMPTWVFMPPNSIAPSINYTAGCRSHFTITNGVPG
jgi:hypothetical protein